MFSHVLSGCQPCQPSQCCAPDGQRKVCIFDPFEEDGDPVVVVQRGAGKDTKMAMEGEVVVEKEFPSSMVAPETVAADTKKVEDKTPLEEEKMPPREETQEEQNCVEIRFVSDRGVKHIEFYEGPVGIMYEKRTPLVITGFKEGSMAKKLGVEVDDMVACIDKIDLTHCKTFDDAQAIVEKQLESSSIGA